MVTEPVLGSVLGLRIGVRLGRSGRSGQGGSARIVVCPHNAHHGQKW